MRRLACLAALAVLAAFPTAAGELAVRALPVNIIDGTDERDSLLTLGPKLGLSAEEIARIRRVSGSVGCLAPTPSVGSAALFLSSGQIITAAHVLIDPAGGLRSKCFFRNQDPHPFMSDLLLGPKDAVFGAARPRPGSNDDYAIVRLADPVPDAEPFPVDASDAQLGEALIVVTGHPAGMAKAVDASIPVVQNCRVRRVPKPRDPAASSFYRSDCDATGASSGGMHLARVGARLVFRGITISTGPWESGTPAEKLRGAPYDEAKGSVTTALGTGGAILRAGRGLANIP